jgi:hypothetical protein
MSDYVKVRHDLAEALTAAGVRTHETYPPTISPPAAVVEFPEEIDYRRTGCLDGYTAIVRLFTARSADGEIELLTLASAGGVAAMVGGIGGVMPRRARNFGSVQVAGADLYTCEIVLELIT